MLIGWSSTTRILGCCFLLNTARESDSYASTLVYGLGSQPRTVGMIDLLAKQKRASSRRS
jgi:hypothetical protein